MFLHVLRQGQARNAVEGRGVWAKRRRSHGGAGWRGTGQLGALTTTHKLLLASAGTFLKRSSKSVRVDVSLFAYGRYVHADTSCIPRDPIERLMQQGDGTHSSLLHTLPFSIFPRCPPFACINSSGGLLALRNLSQDWGRLQSGCWGWGLSLKGRGERDAGSRQLCVALSHHPTNAIRTGHPKKKPNQMAR